MDPKLLAERQAAHNRISAEQRQRELLTGSPNAQLRQARWRLGK